MLLAVNIGNSRTSVGILDQDSKIIHKFKLTTDINKTSDEYSVLMSSMLSEREFDIPSIGGVILSSVVPQLTVTVAETLLMITGKEPLIVGPGVKTGYSIKIDTPSELGGDIVANSAAVILSQKSEKGRCSPTVIVDMNTVTTISAINCNGEFIGCSICPGIKMSFDAMHGNTALLPNVMLSTPQKAIGKNSQESVRSGVIYGNAFMIDGFINKYAKEMRCKKEELNLIITGEYARNILSVCDSAFTYDEDLTLKGLFHIYRNNINNNNNIK